MNPTDPKESPLSQPPHYPHVAVELTHLQGRPVAAIALVRRHLQRAGHPDAARQWTDEAMDLEESQILAAARLYVNVS